MSQSQTVPLQSTVQYGTPEMQQLDTQALLDAYRLTGDENYKWELVLRCKDVLKKVAMQTRGIYSHFAQVEDVISEGVLVLLNAIDKYDPEKGAKFDTYVSRRIRGMVIDMARKQDWMPRSLRKRTKEIDLAVTELYNELNHYPSDAEIADRLGISSEKYQKETAAIALGNVLSLGALGDADRPDGSMPDLPERDWSVQPESVIQEHEFRSVLADGIRSLKKNEQIVLSLYYEKNLHMKEIAQVMDVSAPRVSQIHSCAIEKLRAYMDAYLNDQPYPPNPRRKKE